MMHTESRGHEAQNEMNRVTWIGTESESEKKTAKNEMKEIKRDNNNLILMYP